MAQLTPNDWHEAGRQAWGATPSSAAFATMGASLSGAGAAWTRAAAMTTKMYASCMVNDFKLG